MIVADLRDGTTTAVREAMYLRLCGYVQLVAPSFAEAGQPITNYMITPFAVAIATIAVACAALCIVAADVVVANEVVELRLLVLLQHVLLLMLLQHLSLLMLLPRRDCDTSPKQVL